MACVRILEQHELTDPIALRVYDEILNELGFGIVPNVFKSMANRPKFLEANWNHFRSTILHGDIPRTLKEMVGVAISQANNSQYALNVHLHGLSALGMSEDVLRTLVTNFDACPLPEREKTMIRFGLKIATRPLTVTQADYDGLRAIGLDDDEIFEVVATAHLFTGINQYTDAINLEIDTL
ncbi:MAG: peroxidase-related enzyme [Pleurocapsa minor GSE-CHR-MK-17-07R]|jgi:uncharacterized peroxidase-related enzyme|nr:peroxidase-related enzyme [Pleurocapsa minor GSE-CHR-MK 17-07R]